MCFKTVFFFFSSFYDSANRIGSLRSQTQYSDISFERRSPKTLRLSIIKHSNGTTIQPNKTQITLNRLEKRSLQNGNAKRANYNQSLSSNKSLNLTNKKSAQLNETDKKEINSNLNDQENNEENEEKNNQNENSSTSNQNEKGNQIKFPSIEKLIEGELRKLNKTKHLSPKLIRRNTAIEIDDYRPKFSKIAQNHKLIFSDSIG